MNKHTKLPPNFYHQQAHFIDAFKEIANKFGDSDRYAERLFRPLPQKLKCSSAFLLSLINKWCYEFGDIFELPSGKNFYGSEQFPEVEFLYRALRAADKHLSDSCLLEFIQKLGNQAKHMDALGELAPLCRIKDNVKVGYEVDGYGSKKIDWLFTPPTGTPILLEVKYRLKDLIKSLDNTKLSQDPNEQKITNIHLNPEWLFKNTEDKFPSQQPTEILQGIWIHNLLAQKLSEFTKYFELIDNTKIHFIILCRWRDEGYFLCRDSVNKQYLKMFFDLKESNRFIYTDDS